MKQITVYNVASGEIVKTASAPDDHLDMQCGVGESYCLGIWPGATHIVAGQPVTRDASPLPLDVVLGQIRARRNAKLTACDWTQLPDAPADKAAWAVYRQKLRDMPECCDPYNPTWPVPPV